MPGLYACVLIGGKSTRMGHPKHLIEIEGSSLVERLVETLRPFVRRIYISGAGRLPHSLGKLPRLPDPKGVKGPIAGLCAAFRKHPRSAWLLCACDMPNISTRSIKWLTALRRTDFAGVIPISGLDAIEPLFAIYEPQLRASVKYAAENRSGPKDLVDSTCRCPHVPRDLAHSWKNINTPTELANISGDSISR